MAKELQTVEVTLSDKNEYFITSWTTRKTYANLFKLGKLFAPISSAITEALLGGEKLQEIIPGTILFLCDELDDRGFEKLFNMITEDVTGANGVGKLDMDDLEPHCVIEILTKCLEIYYKDFFEKTLNQVKSLIQETMKIAQLDQQLNQKAKTKKV